MSGDDGFVCETHIPETAANRVLRRSRLCEDADGGDRSNSSDVVAADATEAAVVLHLGVNDISHHFITTMIIPCHEIKDTVSRSTIASTTMEPARSIVQLFVTQE